MNIIRKSFLINIVFSILMIGSAHVYSQNLPELCQEASADLKTIQATSNTLLSNSNNNEFHNNIKPIHDKWIQKVTTDPCASGGCELQSNTLKMSLIITQLSGLTSKLMTQNTNQLIEELGNNPQNSFILKSNSSINRICENISQPS